MAKLSRKKRKEITMLQIAEDKRSRLKIAHSFKGVKKISEKKKELSEETFLQEGVLVQMKPGDMFFYPGIGYKPDRPKYVETERW